MDLALRGVIGLCLLAGCSDHLSIGAFDDAPLQDAAPLDASALMLDATPQPVVTGPLEAKLSVAGRDDYSRVFINCGSPCIGVDVKIQGGTPPYEVTWSDGRRGSSRQFCYPRTVQPRNWSASILDATAQRQDVSFQTTFAITRDQDCQGGTVPSLRVCVAPSAPLQCASQPGLWYPLSTPVQPGNLEARAAFAPPLESSLNLELGVASGLCSEVAVLASGLVTPLSAGLTGTTMVFQPQSFLIVRARDSTFPLSLEPTALGLCFPL